MSVRGVTYVGEGSGRNRAYSIAVELLVLPPGWLPTRWPFLPFFSMCQL